jgi:mRNA-degrading endonuclease RelE of RelBE toxin-antitoxin system
MPYNIVFTTDGSDAFEALEHMEQRQVWKKLDQIAYSEFRDPREWDFCRMEGCADGRFSIGGGLRVFADIDDGASIIRIHHVGRRENLYT